MNDIKELSRSMLRNLGDSLAAAAIPPSADMSRVLSFDDVYYPITVYREYPAAPHTDSLSDYVRLSTEIVERCDQGLSSDAIRAAVYAQTGGGKTFFLTRVAGLLAQGTTDDVLFNRCVGLFGEEVKPLFPVLADISLLSGDMHGGFTDMLRLTSLSIPKHRVSAEEFEAFFTDVCERGEALLLIDNADAYYADEFLVMLKGWLSDYPLTNVILSASVADKALQDFAPYRLSPIVSHDDFSGYAEVWFRAGGFDPERGAELLGQYILRQGYDYRAELCGNPMYLSESLGFLVCDPTLDYEYDNRMVECALSRYTDSANKLLDSETARLLLRYIAAAVSFGGQRTLPHERLTQLIGNAVDEFDPDTDVTPDDVFHDFLHHGFLIGESGGYSLYFPEHILDTLAAGAVLLGDAPGEYDREYLTDKAVFYPGIAVAAAAADSAFAVRLFRSLTPVFEHDGKGAYLSRLLAAGVLTVCNDISDEDAQVFYSSFSSTAPKDIVVIESLFSSPGRMNEFTRFVRRGFEDSVADGGCDYAYAVAACEASGLRDGGYCGVFDRLDELFCSDTPDDLILALYILRLMCDAIACYPPPDEQMAGVLGVGYSSLMLSPHIVKKLNELVESFAMRYPLSMAIQSAFFAGIIDRDDFEITNEECIRRLHGGCDEVYETLLAVSDLFSEDIPVTEDRELLLRYAGEFVKAASADYDPSLYRLFKIFAAAGGFGEGLLPHTMLIQERCMKLMEDADADPDDNVLYINADKQVVSVNTTEGERYIIVCDSGERDDYILKKTLNTFSDRITVRVMLSILLRLGVVTRVLRVMNSGLRDETAVSLLREGSIVKDNFTLINRVLAEYDLFDDRVDALNALLSDERFPRQKLDKNAVLFFKQQALNYSADGLEALALLDRVYHDELSAYLTFADYELVELRYQLTDYPLGEEEERFLYYGVGRYRVDAPDDDDMDKYDSFLISGKRYLPRAKYDLNGCTYILLNDPDEKLVFDKEIGKFRNNILPVRYDPDDSKHPVKPVFTADELDYCRYYIDTFNKAARAVKQTDI